MKASPHRPTRAVVDLTAIAFNIKQIAAHLPQETKKWAVVKADAYGHGAVAVSSYLETEEVVDGFCVSNIDEALELRAAGLKKKILVLGVSDLTALDLARTHQVCLTVASLDWLDLLEEAGLDVTGLVCHIKVDSGMGRIGFRDSKSVQRAIERLEAAGAQVEGIFTHFATADEPDQEKFEEQLANFQALLAALPQKPALIHASNSATSLWHAETVMQAVRLGDIIYGLNPSGDVLDLPYEIKPALSLESQLVHVKKLPENSSVGYGASYVTSQEEYIGTLPIGYADGWTRDMQGFSVLVDGQFCPIVGRVSMDQTTIRLPKAYPLGTPVILIGSSGQAEITASQVAQQRATINYEVVCLLSDRVPRVYRSDD
ncbi:alanine racemase [Streptococcus oricebi]|uniref:Alanine racemase n=1 Tax=Streptococcus oricebi TaxID=1547447 RepID=A0ABS5B5A8_9STRE|nr:alanine racemase [Streptococcus oricebi]MBP2624023.1 alanine racemase [Streptococcus oricebi]